MFNNVAFKSFEMIELCAVMQLYALKGLELLLENFIPLSLIYGQEK